MSLSHGGRSRRPLQSGVGMNSHLGIRWNRASVLVAALAVLLVLAGLAIFRGADTGHAGSTTDAPPAAAALPTGKPCPPPTSRLLRTAPRKGESRTVAL